MDRYSLELLCVLAWFAWYEKNKFVHGNPMRDLNCTLIAAREYLNEFQISDAKQGASLNGDHIGLGAVVRDSRGYVFGLMSKSIPGMFSPYIAECIALLEGLRIARSHGLMISIAETDAHDVRECSS